MSSNQPTGNDNEYTPDHYESNDDELTESDDMLLPPPSRRRRPLAIIAAIAVIVILVGGGLALAHTVSGGGTGATATPAATLLPGENLFYITTNPAWGTVSIDGHTVTHLPSLGSTPLTLSAGGHTIVWSAPPLPQQKCIIYVPPQSTTGGACSATDAFTVAKGKDAGLQATVISFTLTSSMLSSAQMTSLNSAVQALFDMLSTTTTVQPGEQYVDANAPNNVTTANQPLKAAFRLHLDTNPNSGRTCYATAIGTGQSCTSISGQDCYTYCNSPIQFDLKVNPAQNYSPTWDVLAVAYNTWDFTTMNGQSVAANQPDTTSGGIEYLTPLYITWTGSQWHVSLNPIANDPLISPLTYSPSCNLALALVNGNNSFSNPFFSITINGQVQTLSWQYFNSEKNEAQGCLEGSIIMPSNPSTPVTNNTPTAYLLYRFGVLLAANSLAHRWWPSMPVVTAYEQRIVQQLLSKKQ